MTDAQIAVLAFLGGTAFSFYAAALSAHKGTPERVLLWIHFAVFLTLSLLQWEFKVGISPTPVAFLAAIMAAIAAVLAWRSRHRKNEKGVISSSSLGVSLPACSVGAAATLMVIVIEGVNVDRSSGFVPRQAAVVASLSDAPVTLTAPHGSTLKTPRVKHGHRPSRGSGHVHSAGTPHGAKKHSTPDVITNPDWIRKPTGAEIADVYPQYAQEHGIHGSARISCSVNQGGDLVDCLVAAEDPQGYGFAAAALKALRNTKMRPMMLNGRPAAGGHITIPFNFQ